MRPLDKTTSELITIDQAGSLPREFITGTWLPGLYYGNEWFREIDHDIFFTKYLGAVLALLERPGVHVTLATLKDDSDTVVGYSVWERPAGHWAVLHWLYVRHKWRKKGIGANLVPPGVMSVSHLTKIGRAIKPKEWKFDPFL